ncbi:MAG: DNA repair protein RecO, partial [Desulfobacula sp.]|nr:DNA repair protein RecO [Desulfobacula sp.]
IAKNAKKSSRRFTGALDLFSLNHIHCTFPKKNKAALTILAQNDLEDGFGNIRYDIYKTAYASFWVEVIHSYMEEEKAEPQFYDLLLFALSTLNAGSISKEVIHLLFQIRFMALSGFEPNIESCGVCYSSIDAIQGNKIVFDLKNGQILCMECAKQRLHLTVSKTSNHKSQIQNPKLLVSKGTLKQLFWINNSDINRVDRIKFSDSALKEGQYLLESFIPFHLGREFKSLHFLNRLRQDSILGELV